MTKRSNKAIGTALLLAAGVAFSPVAKAGKNNFFSAGPAFGSMFTATQNGFFAGNNALTKFTPKTLLKAAFLALKKLVRMEQLFLLFKETLTILRSVRSQVGVLINSKLATLMNRNLMLEKQVQTQMLKLMELIAATLSLVKVANLYLLAPNQPA